MKVLNKIKFDQAKDRLIEKIDYRIINITKVNMDDIERFKFSTWLRSELDKLVEVANDTYGRKK